MTATRLLLAVLLLAAALRFVGLDWDSGHAFHPDERRIAFALEEISFRPLQLNPRFFAYGSFPLYCQEIWTGIAAAIHPPWRGFHGQILTGRALSAAVGVAMVAWLYLLGRHLTTPPASLLAALFLALAVLPIQHAHFITVDLHQAFLVLVALERLVAYVRSGRKGPLVGGAAAVGLALATKVSSLPLLAPLALAPLLDGGGGRVGRRLAWSAAAVTLAAVFFLAGQPYALLDASSFLADVREQSAMARNAGSVPYTIQYLGTRPWLDDLRQAFTWGLGPALGLAAGAGALAAIARALRRGDRGEILLLSFFLPYFVVTGSFPVKFMRYLLPLYPLWCLWAARLLLPEGRTGTLRKTAAVVVVALTAGYALAFTTIYLRPHPWITASRWFHRHVPEGATVLRTHWEEGFPVSVRDVPARSYRFLELPLYEPDGDRKIALLAGRLAVGDVLVFPSKRLYGAISNAPRRYPATNRFLELLFAEELGYRLEKAFRSPPSLFGFELDDDFADESFSVYDHPKTLVFRRSEELSPEEVLERLRTRIPRSPMTREAMLAAGTAEAAPSASWRIERGWPALLVWTGVLLALAVAGERILRAAGIPAAAAAGLGPVAGYLAFLYGSWILPALRLAPFETATLAVIFAAVLALGGGLVGRAPGGKAAAGRIVCFASFAFFLAVRAWNPEIYWGEKPMDFAFLNSLWRSADVPPPEPWMAGTAINYPYLGHFGIAALAKLTRVDPAIAFNLGIATMGALTAAGAYGAGVAISGRSGAGLLAALLVVFAGNLAGPAALARQGELGFDYFWATSRVIAGTINEFPLWSFLFADLHAHVMALPLSILLLGLVSVWFPRREALPLPLVVLASLSLGAIATTSTWSLPAYAAAIAGIGAFSAARSRRIAPVAFPLAAVALSFVWFLPYWRRYVPPPGNWGFETQSAPLSGVLAIFGLFLCAVVFALIELGRRRGLGLRVLVALGAALAVVSLVSPRLGAAFLAAACLTAAFHEDDPSSRLAFVLAAGGSAIIGLADTLWFWDRMNTVFKLYLESWLLLALASACWLGRRPFGASRLWIGARRAVIGVLAAACAFTAVTDVVAILRTRRVPGPRPALDGRTYLESHRPADAMAIRWMNETIPGTPVLVEAQGPSYGEFGRISMHTGLPAVLGWDYHLFQRAHSWPEIDGRKAAVETIYSSTERPVVESLLRSTGAAIVYVGPLERRTYPPAGLAKLDAWDDLFQPIYRNDGAAVYAVVPTFRWSERAATETRAPPGEARPIAPPGSLREPRGIALDGDGNLWVADFGNDRVQELGPRLEPLRAIGGEGDEPGRFEDPCGIAVGPDGRVYVADTWNHRVQVLDDEGLFLFEWSAGFYGPRGIAVGPDGSVYVADTGNGRIVRFAPDGREITRWGGKGSGREELDEPTAVVVGADGRVHVADAANRRIVVFSEVGEVLDLWPVPGWTEPTYREPGLALRPDGRLIASDPPADRLFFFDRDGRIAGTHRFPPGTGPAGLAVRPDGVLYVAALKQGRIIELAAEPPPDSGT